MHEQSVRMGLDRRLDEGQARGDPGHDFSYLGAPLHLQAIGSVILEP